MNQLQLDDQALARAPPRLDTIPEDAALQIVKFVQSWAEVKGDEEKREKGRRARDSALRALSMCCKKSFTVFFPSFLSNVTISVENLFHFYQFLKKNEDYGRLVKIATFDFIPDEAADDEAWKATTLQLRSMSTTSCQHCAFESGIRAVIEFIYQRLTQVEVLVIQDLALRFSFQSKFPNGRMTPLPFLSTSLKKLSIAKWDQDEANVSGKEISVADYDLLLEHSNALEGISSIKKLALKVKFDSHKTNTRTWWGTSREFAQSFEGGSTKKTHALILLLKITNSLTALEMYVNSGTENPQDRTEAHSSCISSLHRCFATLKHLRLDEFVPDSRSPTSTDYSLFKNLRILTVDEKTLFNISRHNQIKFPPNLEIIYLFCFHFHGEPRPEEFSSRMKFLTSFFETRERELSRLKEVIVPLHVISNTGWLYDSPELEKAWKARRDELQKLEIFKSGSVQFRAIEAGEQIGDACEIFTSVNHWLQPPAN